MRYIESNLQRECVAWFNIQYPQYHGLLFAIPNGGARNRDTAQIMKGEGVVAGVADLAFCFDKNHILFIEMKTDKGRQRDSQRWWQGLVESRGFRYEVVRSFDAFKALIDGYVRECSKG